MQRLSYRHWPWRNGVIKTPPFLHFPNAQGGTKTISPLSIAEGLSFRSLDRRIYDYILRNEKKPDFIRVGNEVSPLTSKLVALLAIKKQGGALVL